MKAFACILVCLVLTACGGGSSSNPPPPAPTLTGTWTFAATSSDFSTDVIKGTAVISQSGTVVSGQVTLNDDSIGPGCGAAATISGTASGMALTLQIAQDNSSLSMTGNATSDDSSASGAYTATTGNCLQNGGSGTWTATKK